MPLLANRVQETSTSGGTGTVTLSGAVTGYLTFASSFSIGDQVYYVIDNGSGEWEIGVGTVGSGTLSRNSVLESSNANALVNFSAGTKRVFCSAPTKVLLPDETSNSGKVLTTNGTDPAWTSTLNGITLGNITPGSGAFTTLSASSTVSGTGFSTYLASPPAIGGTTPAAGNFTTLGATGNVTLGDASGDTLTINGTAVSAPNGLNVNSNQLVLSGGNFGLGVIPSGWDTVSAMQIGRASLYGYADYASGWSSNAYYASEWKYIASGSKATQVRLNSGVVQFFTSTDATQTAGSAIAFTQNMTLTSKGLLVGYTDDGSLSGTGNAIFYGNVGIGTATNPDSRRLRVYGVSEFDGDGVGLTVYKSSGTKIGSAGQGNYVVSGGPNDGYGIQSQTALVFGAGGTTQKMILDTSGNLGLGVTPGYRLDVLGASGVNTVAKIKTVHTGSYGLLQLFNSNANGEVSIGYRDESDSDSTSWVVGKSVGLPDAFGWYYGGTKMLLDASGNLIVGDTSAVSGERLYVKATASTGYAFRFYNTQATAGNTYGQYILYTASSPNGTNNQFLRCDDSTATRAEIRSNGGLANYSANNVNLSDERVKTAITPAPSWLAKINAIEVVNFQYKDQTHEDPNLGVIAQQVLSVAPELVDEDGFGETPEDGVPLMAIYETDLKYAMLKAIQELHAEIEQLKMRIH